MAHFPLCVLLLVACASQVALKAQLPPVHVDDPKEEAPPKNDSNK